MAKFRPDRLLKLAEFLEKNSRRPKSVKFNMNCWGYVDAGEEPKNECGTTGCAWGSAAAAGIFAKEGVRVRVGEPTSDGTKRWFDVTYSGEVDGHAAGAFFGLTYEEVVWIFTPEFYPDKARKGARGERAVAKRIFDFVHIKKGLPGLEKKIREMNVARDKEMRSDDVIAALSCGFKWLDLKKYPALEQELEALGIHT